MYSAEESSPPAYRYESCCVCDEDFSSDSELANHLLDHADDEEFKISLQELEEQMKTPTPTNTPIKVVPEFKTTTFVREPSQSLKRNFTQRSKSPEVWEIISDDSDDEATKNKKAPKLSNSFRLVTPPVSTPGPSTSAGSATPPYNCQPCKMVFNDLKLYKEHLLTHDKARPYVCQICNKKFAYKGTLRQHLHLHIAEKSHECKVCHKKFSMKRMLRQHEETAHNIFQSPVTTTAR